MVFMNNLSTINNIFLEKQLATLLGWFGIVQYQNKLIGYMSGDNPGKTFRQTIPQYTRNVEVNEKLATNFCINIVSQKDTYYGNLFVAHTKDYDNPQIAKMILVALEVIDLLEEYQCIE